MDTRKPSQTTMAGIPSRGMAMVVPAPPVTLFCASVGWLGAPGIGMPGTYMPPPKESVIRSVMKSTQLDYEENKWILQRFITIGYYALVEFEKVVPVPDPLSASCAWRDISDLPPLIFDHRDIIMNALTSMRHHLNNQPIGYNLLPKEFTMKNLQSIYETILNRKLDRSNFNRKMLAAGILDKKEKLYAGGAHKAPYLYSFNKKNYFRVLKEGFNNEF